MLLSLYSTATQNYWRWGLALGNAKIYQHVSIFWRYLTLKFVLPPTPTPGGVGSSGVGHVYFMYITCIFHVVYASFSELATRELADAKADSSGIQALMFRSPGPGNILTQSQFHHR